MEEVRSENEAKSWRKRACRFCGGIPQAYAQLTWPWVKIQIVAPGNIPIPTKVD